MTETEKAYLAGFIDGEGCIQITLLDNNSWQIRLNVYNTNLSILEEIKSFVSCGSLYCKKPAKSSWKNQYVLYWCGRTAMQVMRQVFPYLRLKRKQAEIFLQWKHYKHDHINRKRLWKEMKTLNQRGRVAETKFDGQVNPVCDSPNIKDDKLNEQNRNNSVSS